VGVLMLFISSGGKKHWSSNMSVSEFRNITRELNELYMGKYRCWILICEAALGQSFSNILAEI
jgi:hypothetical protein